jgi:hypothetical protein
MAMSKKDFIALADAVKGMSVYAPLTAVQIAVLADFCQDQNPAFMRDRWINYIAGNCGKNGGSR